VSCTCRNIKYPIWAESFKIIQWIDESTHRIHSGIHSINCGVNSGIYSINSGIHSIGSGVDNCVDDSARL